MSSTGKIFLYSEGRDNQIPDIVAQATRRIHPLNLAKVPSTDYAVQMYTNADGVVTCKFSFGNDPLASDLTQNRNFSTR